MSLLLPKTYTGVTRILPPQQAQSAAAMMLGQLGGGLGALAGGSLGIKNPSDLYVGMLRSQTIADALVERFKLKELYREGLRRRGARRSWPRNSRFQAEKSGIITIQVEARDPKLAADLANAYVEQLYKLTSTLAVGEAAQRRAFFERHLQQTKEKLADAEVKLRQAIESGGLVSVDAQGRAAVETVARLRAQMSAKEIQIGAMKSYATPSNPDLQRAERELVGHAAGALPARIGNALTARPAAGTRRASGNIRLVREVKYNEVMFELLAKQYELARVDEAKEAPLVQVLDRAIPPEKRSGPKRALIVIISTLAGFLAAVVVARRQELSRVRPPGPRLRGAALRPPLRLVPPQAFRSAPRPPSEDPGHPDLDPDPLGVLHLVEARRGPLVSPQQVEGERLGGAEQEPGLRVHRQVGAVGVLHPVRRLDPGLRPDPAHAHADEGLEPRGGQVVVHRSTRREGAEAAVHGAGHRVLGVARWSPAEKFCSNQLKLAAIPTERRSMTPTRTSSWPPAKLVMFTQSARRLVVGMATSQPIAQ